MYLVLDTETTGLPDHRQAADAVGQPRVASVAMIFCDGDLNIQAEYSSLIRPDGWEMPAHVAAINGLRTDYLVAEGCPILIPLLLYGAAIMQGRVVVAHNPWFDTKMMRGELRRAGLRDLYFETRTINTHPWARTLCSNGKLGTAYWQLCDRMIEGAHTALADARACREVLLALRARLGEQVMVPKVPQSKVVAA